MRDRIVLAFAGDLRTSAAIPWLLQHRRAEVIAVTLDLGQRTDLEEVRRRALSAGAARAHVLDVREEFARDFILRALDAGVLCRDGYPMNEALARPLIAKTLVDVARLENAHVVAHGAGAHAADGVEKLVRDLDSSMHVVSPGREWDMTGEQLIAYAGQHGVTVPRTEHERDRTNLWGRWVCSSDSSESGHAGNLFRLTRSRDAAADLPAAAAVGFNNGIPASINEVPMPLTELLESLTLIAGQHGVGRFDSSDRHNVGPGNRVICEAPASHLLHIARADLETRMLPPDLIAIKDELSDVYADVTRGNHWFTPRREALDAFFASARSRLTGTAHLQLLKGEVLVAAPEMVSLS